MTPEVLVRLVTGAGGALAVMALGLWMFYTGKIHSHTEFTKLEQRCTALEAAQATERAIADRVTQTAEVTAMLLQVLRPPSLPPPQVPAPSRAGGD